MDDMPIMQRENESGRIVLSGKRTDDGERCSLLVVRETGGTWSFFPHGASALGVRLPGIEATRLAAVLADLSR